MKKSAVKMVCLLVGAMLVLVETSGFTMPPTGRNLPRQNLESRKHRPRSTFGKTAEKWGLKTTEVQQFLEAQSYEDPASIHVWRTVLDTIQARSSQGRGQVEWDLMVNLVKLSNLQARRKSWRQEAPLVRDVEMLELLMHWKPVQIRNMRDVLAETLQVLAENPNLNIRSAFERAHKNLGFKPPNEVSCG